MAIADAFPDTAADAGARQDTLDTTPAIVRFTASPTTISAGQSSTLSWTVTDAAMLSLDQGVGSVLISVLGETSQVVTPTHTTTYTLTLNGSVSAQVTVTVEPLPSITSFSANPTMVSSGGSATLTALFSGGTGTVDQGIGTVTSGVGTNTGPISANFTTYTLTVTNVAGASTTAHVTVVTSGFVTFSSGRAQGVMSGLGWVALGALDSITDPTCGGTPITKAAPCLTSTSWNVTDALCITGTIPALPANPMQSDYDANLGLQIGVNINADDSQAIGQTFSTIAVVVSGSPTAGLRVDLHRQGDPGGTTYCAANTGAAMNLTSFNTKCWDGSGTAFTAADAPLIDRVGVQVPSTKAAVTVTNLCINSVTFGN